MSTTGVPNAGLTAWLASIAAVRPKHMAIVFKGRISMLQAEARRDLQDSHIHVAAPLVFPQIQWQNSHKTKSNCTY
jgi:hypothetical protein